MGAAATGRTSSATSGLLARAGGVLITGAGGEVGHGLIHALAGTGGSPRLFATDLRELEPSLREHCESAEAFDIRDDAEIARVLAAGDISTVFHLAALLSTSSEKNPELAFDVNVGGTMALLKRCAERAVKTGSPIRVIYPSTIAVYGLPDLTTKARAGAISEDQHLNPITMYGCNKLSCEHLGRYFAEQYRMLSPEIPRHVIDFRGVRYPGLISADTVPTGGTSDFGPEMLHAAAQGKAYTCFVREDARIPFMTMPAAIRATLKLAGVPRESLTRHVYNISAFAPSAGEFAALVREFFPQSRVSYDPHPLRQMIVDSWPADIDCAAAQKDWGFDPGETLRSAFEKYLVPAIKKRYGV